MIKYVFLFFPQPKQAPNRTDTQCVHLTRGVFYKNMIARPFLPIYVRACSSWTYLANLNLQPCLLPIKHSHQDALHSHTVACNES